VARVYDHYLYRSDISGIGAQHSSRDSQEMARDYIENWAKRMLLLEKAERSLPEELLDVDKQIQDYRASLILFTFEKELIAQKLDTVVTQQQITEYYNRYVANFQLSEGLLRFQYLIIPEEDEAAKQAELLWTGNPNGKLSPELRQLAEKHAKDYQLDPAVWMEKSAVTNNFPLNELNLINMNQNQNVVQQSKDGYMYLMKVNELRNVGSTAPLAYVQEDIRKIIINKRRVELLDDTYKKVYDDGLNSNNFEIY